MKKFQLCLLLLCTVNLFGQTKSDKVSDLVENAKQLQVYISSFESIADALSSSDTEASKHGQYYSDQTSILFYRITDFAILTLIYDLMECTEDKGRVANIITSTRKTILSAINDNINNFKNLSQYEANLGLQKNLTGIIDQLKKSYTLIDKIQFE